MSDRRFVLLSDIHSHPWSAFAKGDGLGNTRLRLTLNILEASLARAETLDCPWVFAGDLVHTAGYALNAVLAGITDILAMYHDVKKIVLWGNHDARGIGGRITLDQTVFGTLARTIVMTVLDPSVTPEVECGGIVFSGAGYQPRAGLVNQMRDTEVGIYHQTVAGSRAANGFLLEEGVNSGDLLDRHRLSIVGHVHHPQEIAAPEGQGILIPGSPEQHNFGDHGDRGWWVVTLPGEDADPQLEFIPGGSPKFLTVDTPAEIQRGDGHYYRVRVVPPGEALPDGVAAIAPTPTTISHRDLLQGAAEVEQILKVWMQESPPPTADAQDYLAIGSQLLGTQEPVALRNIQLTSLSIKDFCCFEEQDLDITPGIHLITGQGRDYPSNGAGKSSLVGESLYWLLFGRTTKGLSADDVIRWGAEACEVQGTFLEGTSLLEVHRYRGPEGHILSVTQDHEEWEAVSVNAMTAKLGQYLGITPEIFQNLAYFSQEKLLLFSSATDGERKNVLADLIGLRTYQDASTLAASTAAEHEQERLRWGSRAEAWEEQLVQAQAESTVTQAELAEWEGAHEKDIEDANRVLVEATATHKKAVQEAADALNALRTEVDALIAEHLKDLETERPVMEAALREEAAKEHTVKLGAMRVTCDTHIIAACVGAQDLVRNLEEAKAAVLTLPDEELQLTVLEEVQAAIVARQTAINMERMQTQTLHEQLQAQIVTREREAEEAQKVLAEGICPTCQQTITEGHRDQCLRPLQAKLESLLKRLPAVEADLEDLSAAGGGAQEEYDKTLEAKQAQRDTVARLKNAGEELREVANLEQRMADLQETAMPEDLIVTQVEAEIALLRDTYTRLQNQRVTDTRAEIQSHLLALAQKMGALKLEVDSVQQQHNPFKAILENQVANTTILVVQIQKEQAQIEAVQKTIAIYDYWRTGFSKQGLQSLLVEEIAVRFNANRSDIFPLLTQGIYDVQFSTLSTTRSGELRERTEFLVNEHGAPIPYAALSGGQRRRIDIGIMLVLTQAVAEWMGTKGVLGLLILDEVFGFLDASGAEGLLAALGQIATQVPTIYVITHDTHLQSMIPNTIEVIQGADGISKVVT